MFYRYENEDNANENFQKKREKFNLGVDIKGTMLGMWCQVSIVW